MDLEKLAASGAEMPEGLNTGEQLLFLTLRELYANFRSGAINREQGHREKQRVLDSYRQIKFEQSLFDEHLRLRRRLELEVGSLHKCGCEECRKIAKILDCIDRREIPEDVKQLQETIDKLRVMIRERSERAATYRTKLDSVGWIIDGEGTVEDKLTRIKEVLEGVQ